MRTLKTFPLLIFLSISFPVILFAQTTEQITLTTYYPAPQGSYDQLRLVPRAVVPTCSGPNEWGTLYYDNASQALLICQDDGAGGGQWGITSGSSVWDRNGATQETFLRNLNDFVSLGNNSPEFKLTLASEPPRAEPPAIRDGGIMAKGTFGSGADLVTSGNGARLIWYPKKAAFRAGSIEGTIAPGWGGVSNHWNDVNIGNYSVAFGLDTRASGIASVVAGGQLNLAQGNGSVVSGGYTNLVRGNYATIGGGGFNQAPGEYATIGGGLRNQAIGLHATIGGGRINVAFSEKATVGGGIRNIAGDFFGGAIGQTVVGGGFNWAMGDFAVVVGGESNQATGDHSFVGGGKSHLASGPFSVVGGGEGNTASGDHSVVGGGRHNVASGNYAVVVGGGENTFPLVDPNYVGPNIASGAYSVVVGGGGNTASGDYSVVSGGRNNTASGDYSVVPGGENNIAGGNYSYAGGRNTQLSNLAVNTFAWGVSPNPVAIDAANSFLIFPGGGGKFGINTDTPTAALHVAGGGDVSFANLPLDPGGTTDVWIDNGVIYRNGSSKRYKENIRALSVDASSALQLNPVSFIYKSTKQKDVGLIAEDVEKVIPDLVKYNEQGEPDGLKYEKLALYLIDTAKQLKMKNEKLKMENIAIRQKLEALEKLAK